MTTNSARLCSKKARRLVTATWSLCTRSSFAFAPAALFSTCWHAERAFVRARSASYTELAVDVEAYYIYIYICIYICGLMKHITISPIDLVQYMQ